MEVDFNNYFYYDETSRTGLKWKVNFRQKPNLKYKDAGTSHGGHFMVKLKQKRFLVHRVIWEMFNGAIPQGMVIDHLNGNPSDNRLENLGCKTHAHNSQNCKRNKRNKSGIVGVHFVERCGKIVAVMACIFFNKRKIAKQFTVSTHGFEKSLQLAKDWRADKIAELNKIGAMYTARHGKDEGC